MWESCGNIDGGCIPGNGLMHANTFWVRLATRVFSQRKTQFENFENSKRTHPLTKLNKNKSYYVDKYLGFGRNVYVVKEPFYFNSEQSHNQGIVELTLTTISHLPTT
jgi:hypothetical protein